MKVEKWSKCIVVAESFKKSKISDEVRKLRRKLSLIGGWLSVVMDLSGVEEFEPDGFSDLLRIQSSDLIKGRLVLCNVAPGIKESIDSDKDGMSGLFEFADSRLLALMKVLGMVEKEIEIVQKFMDYFKFERRFSEQTANSYVTNLLHFVAFLKGLPEPPAAENILLSATTNSIRAYMAFLDEERLSKKTINRRFSALKSFYKFLVKREHINSNPAASIMSRSEVFSMRRR